MCEGRACGPERRANCVLRCKILLLVPGPGFRGRFWAGCGRQASMGGPTSGPKLPGPKNRAVLDWIRSVNISFTAITDPTGMHHSVVMPPRLGNLSKGFLRFLRWFVLGPGGPPGGPRRHREGPRGALVRLPGGLRKSRAQAKKAKNPYFLRGPALDSYRRARWGGVRPAYIQGRRTYEDITPGS